MQIIQKIKDFFTPAHTRLLIAFIILFIGATFPQYQILCNYIAAYLGCTIAITAGKVVMAAGIK